MSITVAKSAGFCFGVNRAVETVENAAKENKKVMTLGPIIHNRHVVHAFEKLGVGVLDVPEQAQRGMTVVIRSHGVGRDVLRRLREREVEIIDATCPFVKRIHDLVVKAEQAGRMPLIIGTPSHPEVEGIAGWCESCVVAENPEELMTELEGLSKSKAAARAELEKLFTEEIVLTENAKEPEKGREQK